MNGPRCFACLPANNENIQTIRAECVRRGYHQPIGPQVEHEHVRPPLFRCEVCGTLVAKV